MKRLAALRRSPIGHALETVVLLASIGYAVVGVVDRVDRYRRHVADDDTPDPEPVVAIPVGDEPPPWPGHVAQQVHDAQAHAAATKVEFAPGWQERLAAAGGAVPGEEIEDDPFDAEVAAAFAAQAEAEGEALEDDGAS